MSEQLDEYFEVCYKYANQMICKGEKIEPETLILILTSVRGIIKSNNK